MSSIIDRIDLEKISAPSMNSVRYGDDINNIFRKINSNFEKIANSGFLRGKQGESITVNRIELTEDSEWLNAIKSTIEYKYSKNETALQDLNGIRWFDGLINQNIYLYNTVVDSESDNKRSVSMLPFTLKDVRFSNPENLQYIRDKSLPIEEVSCVIGFNGDYDTLDNPIIELVDTLPTLYFDTNINYFCWKIWGNKTGLVANGPTGAAGANGDLLITIRGARVNTSQNTYYIESVLSNGNPIPVDKKNIAKYANKPTIVLPNTSEEIQDSKPVGFWVSNLNISGDRLIAVCDAYNNILTDLSLHSGIVGRIDPESSGKTGEIFNDYKNNQSRGKFSHAEGQGTTTSNIAEHACGRYNKSNTGGETNNQTIYSIGIGLVPESRKNAIEVMMNGDFYLNGVGGYVGDNPQTSQTVQQVIANAHAASINARNSIQATDDGIFIVMDGVKYKLSIPASRKSQEIALKLTQV